MLMRASGISSGVLLERGADDVASFLRAAHMGAQEKRPPREGRGSHFPPGRVILILILILILSSFSAYHGKLSDGAGTPRLQV